MPKFTISIPKELKKQLDEMPEVNWSEVLRRGIKEKICKLEKFEELDRRGEL